MKKQIMVCIFIIAFIFMSFDQIRAEYGHISFVEPGSQVFVERLNGKKDKAVINLPIIAGDKIISAGESRCEIQFHNGTMIRLDHNTILQIVTLHAKTLTSKKSISTFDLSEGSIYIMANVYNKEIFQIKTGNTAALFKTFSTAILQYKNMDTDLNVYRGSVNIIYGKDIKSFKEGKIKSKNGYTVNSENILVKSKKNHHKDFLLWNNNINKNFDKLHRGISKVPKPIYRYSKGIIYWAEKWSSSFGEWVYDDIFGYVWSPHDESFAYNHRPFFGAEFKRINDKLFMVPSQKWGWAPSQLGTWVFMKQFGWVWIPGDAFDSGRGMGRGMFPYSAEFNSEYYLAYNNLNHWLNKYYGSLELYYTLRNKGNRAWEKAYIKKYGPIVKKKINPPAHIKKIISKMNRTYLSRIKRSIAKPREILKGLSKIGMNNTFGVSNTIKVGSRLSTVQKLKNPGIFKKQIKNKLIKIDFRDFNPDSKWALRKNVIVRYSSKSNSVICDDIKIYRKLIKKSKNRSNFPYSKGTYYENSTSSSSQSSQSNSGGSASKKKKN